MRMLTRRHPPSVAPVALVSLAMLLLPTVARAQLPALGVPPVSFTGEISSLGELYSVSGREARRPSSLGRLSLRSSVELFGAVTVGLDLLFSSESGSGLGLAGSTTRQTLNRIGIEPEWSWGRAYLGSFAESYSSLTWDGVRVQGAGASINPGWLRLGAFYGRSQDAIQGGAIDGTFRRSIWGGRLGVGRASETGQPGFLDLVFIRAADDPASLESPEEVGLEPGAGVTGSPYAVTPQENVVLAAVNRLPLWSGRLIWQGEIAVSVHSRDRRAPVLTDDEALDQYSSLLRSFITPRASTYGDWAYTTRLDLRRLPLPGGTNRSPRTLDASLGYKYIGAGYVSLGLASMPADQSAVNGRVSIRFRTWSASLRALHQHDNLLGQKLATTVRRRLAGNASVRVTEQLRSSIRVGLNTVANRAPEERHRVDRTSWTIATSQSLNLSRTGLWRAVALSHTYQQTADGSPAHVGGDLRAHDADVRLTLAPARSLTVTPALGLAVSRRGEAEWEIRHTHALSAHLRGDGGRWSTTAALSNSRLHDGGSVRASLKGRYNLTPSDRVELGVRSNQVTGIGAGTGFSEYTVSIGWSRSIR